ncbi:MAG: hypothetical protein U0R49_09585 [Fimbriimonadales bacterium]
MLVVAGIGWGNVEIGGDYGGTATMETLINMLKEKTGIDDDAAGKVANFIKDHAADIPGWLGNLPDDGILGTVKDKIGDLLGGGDK